MKYYPLKNFIEFISGINPSRFENENENVEYYDKDCFDYDFYLEYDEDDSSINSDDPLLSEKVVKKGDVVINNAISKAAIVSADNNNKVLPSNYLKVRFKNKKLNRKYFVYLFNFNLDIEIQKLREMQGMGPVLKLTTTSMENIQIPLPPLEEQKKIGCTYIKSLKLQHKLEQYKDLLEELTRTILEENLRR